MEKLFVEDRKNQFLLGVLFFTLSILTFGLSWAFLYDEFIEKHYMTNRRRLIKAINDGSVSLIKRSPSDPNLFSDIEMFDAVHTNGDVYDLWLWTKENGVVKATISDDHIGLFTGSIYARYLNNKLVKTIKNKTQDERF